MQLGVIKTKWNESDNISFRYYSKEHEDFVYTAIQIFRENIFKGSGVKTFLQKCNDLKNDKSEIILENEKDLLNRNNKLKCSTHPHSTYFQILSDTGIFCFYICNDIFYFCIKKKY